MSKVPFLHQQNILSRLLASTVQIGANTGSTNAGSAPRSFIRFDRTDIILLSLSLLALFVWSISLQTVSLYDMNNLGLISALSPWIIAALAILVVSFAVTLQRHEVRAPLLAFQLICIIFMLYATPSLVEEAHFGAGGTLFQHAAYTDYILRTGTVDPWLDFYFNWPGFFAMSAFFTKAFGYSTILSYASWARVFFNLIYLGPMYMIFTSFTTHKRLIWLSLLFFYLTNWIGQDYFSPQGLNLFLYLVIIAILTKWFRMPSKRQVQLRHDASLRQKIFSWLRAPDAPSPVLQTWQRWALLSCLILIYGLTVCSHPLTSFLTLFSVSALVIFRRCYPFWLPILMTAMAAAWIFTLAQPYISQHFDGIFSTLGENVPSSITSGKFTDDPLYEVVAKMRLCMTGLLWLLALLGGLKRLRQGERDVTLILLAIAGFPLMAAPQYGREMLQRIYLLTEPFMCFFAASLFFNSKMAIAQKPPYKYITFPWRTVIIIATNLLLLSAFFFTRYGDERVYYVSSGEWNGIEYLQKVAPAKAFIVEAWGETPLYVLSYKGYDLGMLSTMWPSAVTDTNPEDIIQIMESKKNPNSYIFFSQEQQVLATSYESISNDTMQRLEKALLDTGKFKLIYSNSDAQILQYIG